MKNWILIVMLCCSSGILAQTRFTSVDQVWDYASEKSLTLRGNSIKISQAKKSKLAAILSIPDVTGGASFSYTYNNKLPVSLFPAETFGGEPGTFMEIQTGIPYVSNANENIDVKLINLKSWENLKLSKLEIQNSELENKLSIKALYEDVASIYYNIISLQEQLKNTEQNITSSKELLNITHNKYHEGLIKQQDVNEASISYLNNIESAKQIEYLIEQQYLALKVLCDIPEEEIIVIENGTPIEDLASLIEIRQHTLALDQTILQERIAYSNYRQQKLSLTPTFSFFQSYTSQQYNSRGKLFDNNVNWFPSSYIGLKLSWAIPSSTTISQISTAKYDYQLAQNNVEQQKIKSELQSSQLRVDFNKALSQAKSNKDIYLLWKDNYEKYLNLYREGLVALDKVLDSFNAMVNSHYNLVSSQVAVLSSKTKIDINNNTK